MWREKVKEALCLSAVALFCLLACDTGTNLEEKPAIRVGKRSVTQAALRRDIKWLTSDLEIPPQEWQGVRDHLVDRLVEHYLVLEYGRDKGIAVSEAELDAVIREIRRDYADADFQEVLLKRAVDFDEWKDGLREHLLTRKIMRSVLEGVPPVTNEEIKAYFEAHAEEFKHPPMVRARQVVLRTRGEAQAVLRRLQGGEKMEEIAGACSISPEGKRQGDLGWIARGQMQEAMEKALFSLSPGQTSSVVETPYGFHIFQVISRRPEGRRGLPEVRAEIEERLISRKEEEFFGSWLQELRNLYPVAVDRQLLDRLEWG
ncbi:MAG: peptidyl-prolyl cis-trans isomerase [Thermodesulfobacteriota bacterium]